jgi:hypothetical protein
MSGDASYERAHLRTLARCQWVGCTSPATQELYNGRNAPCGVYCNKHAEPALKRFKARRFPV